jgi:tetratricopeptide (TPR) repeat protein
MVSCLQRKSYLISILIISIIMITLSPVISYPDADRIFKENNKAVVVVITYDKNGEPISQGSGFIVRADGAIVTNYHVISNAEDIKVKAGDKILEVEGLLHTDKENDIVILKAKGENLNTVKIGDIEKLSVGEKVYVISSPQGLENTISDGILSGIREIDPKKKILQITAPISQGSSGSPVFNKNGEVIGIATFLIEEAQNINFAMPVNLIKNKISAKKIIALKNAEIEDYKKTAEYWFIIGYYYGEYDLFKEAIQAYKQAIKIKSDYAEAYYNLGATYDELGMYREAIESFKQTIKIKPDFTTAHLNLGAAYDEIGMYKEAIQAYKQAIKIKPDYAEVYSNLCVTYDKLGMYRDSIEACKQAIKNKPDFVEAHYNLGVTYVKLNMYKEALEAFKQSIRIKPDDVEAHYRIGIIYLILNDRVSALDEYKILKHLEPEMANKLFNMIYK